MTKQILGFFVSVLMIGAVLGVNADAAAGDPVKGKVSTFLDGPYQSASKVSATLKANGFQVLSSYGVIGGTSVVFTCPRLQKMAGKKSRGFAAALRVLVDKKHNQIRITNPKYFLKAYLQSNYSKSGAQGVLDKLNKAFASLKNSKDALSKGDLAGYHFMMGMPYYNDMDIVAKGDSASLLSKVKKNGKMIFQIKLPNGSTLVGVKLSKSTSKFPAKIGSANAAVLPYTVLIEGGKAKTLAPKYNIAIYYPLLSMSQFMKISSVPSEIISDLEKAFK